MSAYCNAFKTVKNFYNGILLTKLCNIYNYNSTIPGILQMRFDYWNLDVTQMISAN